MAKPSPAISLHTIDNGALTRVPIYKHLVNRKAKMLCYHIGYSNHRETNNEQTEDQNSY